MKTIIRNILMYSATLYFLPQVVPGLTITGGLPTLFTAGAILTLLFLIIRPILNIISFPVNAITLGLVALLINMLILYLFTIFVTSVSILPFHYNKLEIWGFIIPAIHFNTFFAYAYVASIIALIESVIKWLTEK